MAMSSSRLWTVAAASVALAACNTAQTHIGDEDPGMGEALKYDAAIQTINPAPVYSATSTQPGSNGDKGASAVKRYRTNAVKEPENIGTTGGGSGGGSGMSAGGGPH
jgi:hypothetical protein